MNCRKLAIGDEILKVDGIVTDVDNVVDLLVGTDIPDSPVNLLIRKKNGAIEEISVARMATSRVADRRQMFEYFTHIKDIAVKVSDSRTAELVDATVDLWSKMLLAQEDYNSTIVTNVRQMQLNLEMLLKEIITALEELVLNAKNEKEFFYQEETEFHHQIAELKQRIIAVEAERDEAIYKHKPCELNIQTLQRRVQGLEEQLDKAIKDHLPCDGKIHELKSQVISLQSDLDQAVHVHQPCTLTIENLKTQLKNTEEDRDLWMRKHTPCDDIIESLRSENRRLELELKRVSDDHAGCAGQIANLNNKVLLLMAEKATLEKEFRKLQDEHAKCQRQPVKLAAAMPTICGVGLRVAQQDQGEVYISEIILHGSCWWMNNKGGDIKNTCQEGDVLLSVDGQPATDVKTVPDQVRGPEGSKVELELRKSCQDDCSCGGSGRHIIMVTRRQPSMQPLDV
uniref:PDZ domain-containing protein n=1 Tax=Hanusia phi TaxID=3032 RepID=A0A7S0HVH9_9CRYP